MEKKFFYLTYRQFVYIWYQQTSFCLYQVQTKLFLSILHMDNFYTYKIDKLSIPHTDKRFLSIWHIYYVSTCGIYKNFMLILGIIIFVFIAYGQFFYIPHRKMFCINYVYKKFTYTIQTKIFLSVPDIDILSIFHVDKSIFVHISQRQIFYIRYELNIKVNSPYRQYIVYINQKHYLYIFIYYLNITHN